MQILNKIQKELKAPKNQKNSFGNYNYRSCEDILEAIKPLLDDKTVVTLNDEIVLVGDRYYVKATAKISNGTESESVTAYARESLDKKGMDSAQITGASSSYARKYALNGLFCIDDTKDADTKDNTFDDKKIPDSLLSEIDKATDEKTLTDIWNTNKEKGYGKGFIEILARQKAFIKNVKKDESKS